MKRDNNGTFHIQLNKGRSLGFFQACQLTVCRRIGDDHKLLSVDPTANNGEFQISADEAAHSYTADHKSRIDLNMAMFCRKNPAISTYTRWTFVENAAGTGYNHTETYAADAPLFPELGRLQRWYGHREEYRNQSCDDKYDKMQFEVAYRCPVDPDGFLALMLNKPFDVNRACFADRLQDERPFWRVLTTLLKLNGRSDAGFGTCAGRRDECNSYLQFSTPVTLTLRPRHLRDYGVWDDGYLNVSISRPKAPGNGDPDQANMIIPLRKRPYVYWVQLDRDKQQLHVHVVQPKSLVVVATVASLSTAQHRADGTTDSQDRPTPEWGQTFICSGFAIGTLSAQLTDLPPGQPVAVLISYLPEWDWQANFSLANPEHRALIERADHEVVYCGNGTLCADRPGWQTINQPCTGHCRTHLLPRALANGEGKAIGSCLDPSTPDPTPGGSSTGAEQALSTWLFTIPVALLLGGSL